MGKIKKPLLYILALLYVFLQLLFNRDQLLKNSLLPTNTPTPTYQNSTTVTRVIDGDTIEIEGKIKVRYIGINTPEIYHDTTGKKTGEQCFANESYLENKRLVEGKTVRLEKDVSETDKYGRLLRYVYVDDLFVNDYLIKNGYAKIMTIKPDVKLSKQFKTDEKEAKENKLGLWEKCYPTNTK